MSFVCVLIFVGQTKLQLLQTVVQIVKENPKHYCGQTDEISILYKVEGVLGISNDI